MQGRPAGRAGRAGSTGRVGGGGGVGSEAAAARGGHRAGSAERGAARRPRRQPPTGPRRRPPGPVRLLRRSTVCSWPAPNACCSVWRVDGLRVRDVQCAAMSDPAPAAHAWATTGARSRGMFKGQASSAHPASCNAAQPGSKAKAWISILSCVVAIVLVRERAGPRSAQRRALVGAERPLPRCRHGCAAWAAFIDGPGDSRQGPTGLGAAAGAPSLQRSRPQHALASAEFVCRPLVITCAARRRPAVPRALSSILGVRSCGVVAWWRRMRAP